MKSLGEKTKPAQTSDGNKLMWWLSNPRILERAMGLEFENLDLDPSPGLPGVGPESGVTVCEMETLAPTLLSCGVPH